MEGIDVVVTPVVFLLGAVLHAAMTRSLTTREQGIANASFLLHAVSGVAQVLLTLHYFGGGDMFGYFECGIINTSLLRDDFSGFAPSVWNAMVQGGEVVPPLAFFGGPTSGSMGAFATWILLACGDSLYGAVMLVSMAAYASKLVMYRALRTEFQVGLQPVVASGLMLLPSAVFWSCGLLKEPLVMVFMGPLLASLASLSRGRSSPLALTGLVLGGAGVALLKPYILMAMSAAAALFYLRSRVTNLWSILTRPVPLAISIVIGFGAFSFGSGHFSKADDSTGGSAFAQQREAFRTGGGGSSFELESQEQGSKEGSALRDAALAPLALVTALFRPFIFEARNAVQLANALEATVLLFLFAGVLRERGLRAVVSEIAANPVLLFAAVFVAALGVGTGLSATNMGSLSRYRAPMMPFFFLLLLVLGSKSRVSDRASRSADVAMAPDGVQVTFRHE